MLEAESFEEHMQPGVTWHDDPAFAEAFAEIIGETIMTEAAYTKPGIYPGYINITRDHTGAFIITTRADPLQGAVVGHTAVVTIPEDEFNQLVAQATRLRVPTEGQEDAGSDDSGGATAGDPLAQRAEPPEDDSSAEAAAEPQSIVDADGEFRGDAWPGAKG